MKETAKVQASEASAHGQLLSFDYSAEESLNNEDNEPWIAIRFWGVRGRASIKNMQDSDRIKPHVKPIQRHSDTFLYKLCVKIPSPHSSLNLGRLMSLR